MEITSLLLELLLLSLLLSLLLLLLSFLRPFFLDAVFLGAGFLGGVVFFFPRRTILSFRGDVDRCVIRQKRGADC